MKQCPICQESKPEEDFAWKFKALGIRSATCKECHNKEYGQAWYEQHREQVIQAVAARRKRYKSEVKEWLRAYLSTHPCVDCGESDLAVLEFDHQDRSNKTMEVSKLINGGYSLKKIQMEVEKCIVRCANCHRRKTAREQDWYKWGNGAKRE